MYTLKVDFLCIVNNIGEYDSYSIFSAQNSHTPQESKSVRIPWSGGKPLPKIATTTAFLDPWSVRATFYHFRRQIRPPQKMGWEKIGHVWISVDAPSVLCSEKIEVREIFSARSNRRRCSYWIGSGVSRQGVRLSHLQFAPSGGQTRSNERFLKFGGAKAFFRRVAMLQLGCRPWSPDCHLILLSSHSNVLSLFNNCNKKKTQGPWCGRITYRLLYTS